MYKKVFLRGLYLLLFFLFACSVGDDKSPSMITDLRFEPQTRLLKWTAPGDDGNSGTATIYDIRFFQDTEIAQELGVSSIDELTSSQIEEFVRGNFSEATQVLGEPPPESAGSAESFIVPRLDIAGEKVFFFAIETRDEVGNSSDPSNVVVGKTPMVFAQFESSVSGSCFGESIGGGDFNGDGIRDIVVGDPCSGRVYLFFGGKSFLDKIAERGSFLDVTSSDTADVTIIGDPSEMFGFSVSGIDSFEGDRSDELVIGAPGYDGGRGRVVVLAGRTNGWPSVVDLTGEAIPTHLILGESPGDNFGFSVTDGTGVIGGAEVILVGAPGADSQKGRVYLFRADDLDEGSNLASSARAIILGKNSGDRFGFSMDQIGRIDDDTLAEFAVGVPERGEVYIIFGSEDLKGIKDLAVDDSDTVLIEGNKEDGFGFSVSGGEDLDDVDVENEDGAERPDLLVGAPFSDMGRGSVFLYSGIDLSSARESGISNPPFKSQFIGLNPGDNFGTSVTVTGDLNPNLDREEKTEGFILSLNPTNSDFVVGAPGISRVYVFFGRPDFPNSVSSDEADLILPLAQDDIPGERFGEQVFSLGDITGDNIGDIAIGGAGFIRVEF
ncbi:MAG: hypothetical protein KatS3mg078_0255 [Deltaproteobacteria bacterium]|jgi:hypothetical protein|nr:MAG: hypothetical protein KatS3mg078_0255 [Deltaproteobacteria bacterium]